MEKWMILAGTLFAILLMTLAIFAIALLAYFFLQMHAPAPAPTAPPLAPQNAASAPNSTNGTAPMNASPGDAAAQELERQWSLITKTKVETACLSQAKTQAVDAGYSAGLVFSCSCNAQESASLKSYACTVSALDGGHQVGIACTKRQRSCEITSEQGTFVYTFAQLSAMENS